MFTGDQLIAFFSSPILGLILKGLVVYLGILWFALVIYVARDIIQRTDNVLFQILVILLNIVLPVFGLLLYLIIRPGKTLLEKYYEDLEYHFLSDQSAEKESCPRCESPLSPDYLFCPNCSDKVKKSCTHCKRVYWNHHTLCPFCGRKGKTISEKK